MSKGKKFNAAEKHFHEKELMFKRMIKVREESIELLKKELSVTSGELSEVKIGRAHV